MLLQCHTACKHALAPTLGSGHQMWLLLLSCAAVPDHRSVEGCSHLDKHSSVVTAAWE